MPDNLLYNTVINWLYLALNVPTAALLLYAFLTLKKRDHVIGIFLIVILLSVFSSGSRAIVSTLYLFRLVSEYRDFVKSLLGFSQLVEPPLMLAFYLGMVLLAMRAIRDSKGAGGVA